MYKINVHNLYFWFDKCNNNIIVLFTKNYCYNHVKYQSTDWFVPMSCMYDVKCKHDQAQLLLLKDVMTKSCKEILIHCSFFTLSLSKTNGRQFSWSLLLQTIENVRLYFYLKIKYIKMT